MSDVSKFDQQHKEDRHHTSGIDADLLCAADRGSRDYSAVAAFSGSPAVGTETASVPGA